MIHLEAFLRTTEGRKTFAGQCLQLRLAIDEHIKAVIESVPWLMRFLDNICSKLEGLLK